MKGKKNQHLDVTYVSAHMSFALKSCIYDELGIFTDSKVLLCTIQLYTVPNYELFFCVHLYNIIVIILMNMCIDISCDAYFLDFCKNPSENKPKKFLKYPFVINLLLLAFLFIKVSTFSII